MDNNEYVDLMSNVKGINKLKILKKDLETLLSSRNVAIYGPNGTGKSSFKEGISKEINKIQKNFRVNDQPVVNEKLQFKNNVIVFDEIMVNLIRRNLNAAKINWFGKEISSLYELLTSQKEVIETFELSQPLENSLFNIKKENLEEFLLILEEIKRYINEFKTSDIKKIEEKELKFLLEFNDLLFQKIINLINSLSRKWFRNSMIFDKKNNRFTNEECLGFKYLFEKFKKNSTNQVMKEKDKEELKKENEKLNKYLENILFIHQNYGYIDLNNEIDFLYEEDFLLGNNNIFGDGIHLFNFIAWLKNHPKNPWTKTNLKENKDKLCEGWYEIKNKVEKVLNIANNLLMIYNIDYDVKLVPTKIKSENGNFALKFKNSSKELNEAVLEETLSYGELNIISLCLFLSSCIIRGIPKETIFIFDDPVSSYDLNRVNITTAVVKSLIEQDKNVKKIYFLSHEKHFIKSLKYPISKNITFWTINKEINYSILKKVNSLESDWEFYKNYIFDDDHITKIIAQRYFVHQYIEIKKMIYDNEKLENNSDLKFISNVTRDYNNVLHKEEPNLEINLEEKDFDLSQLLSFRDKWRKKYGEDFFKTWLENQSQIIIEKIKRNDELSLTEYSLFRSSMYRWTLNAISHENYNNSNLDISRAAEVASILISSKKQMLKDFEIVKNFYETSKK